MEYPRKYQDALDLVDSNEGPVVIIPCTSPNGIRILHVDCFHCEGFDADDPEDDTVLWALAAVWLAADEVRLVGYDVGYRGRSE